MKGPKNVYFSYIGQDDKGNPEFEDRISLMMMNIDYEPKLTTIYRETYRRTMQFTRRKESNGIQHKP